MAMAHHEGNVTKTAVLSKDLIKVDGKLFQCEHTPSRNLIQHFQFISSIKEPGHHNLWTFNKLGSSTSRCLGAVRQQNQLNGALT